MSISFSNSIKFSGIAVFSPNNLYFAISRNTDLIVYEISTWKIRLKFNFCDFIEHIEWSHDSSLILVGLFKRGIAEVKKFNDKNWICRIDEGLAGMSFSRFTPDSKHILSINDNKIKLTIWSLTTKSTLYINFPKFSRKGISFTSNGHFMALAIRENTKDYIGVYYWNKWSLWSKFVTNSSDLQDIQWSFDNSTIIVTDTPYACRLFIYWPTGVEIKVIEPYQYKLGIRKCCLSPNGHYITLGCYDQTIKILNSISYTSVIEFNLAWKGDTWHDDKVNYFQEQEIISKGMKKMHYLSVNPPIKINNFLPKSSDVNPKMGVKRFEYSYDSNFIAVKNENMGNVLWVYEWMGMNLHTVIIQLNEISDFKWSKDQHILFIATENERLYYFTWESIYAAELEGNGFTVNEIELNGDGRKFILKNLNNMIIGDIGANDNENGEWQQSQSYQCEQDKDYDNAEEEYEEMGEGDGDGMEENDERNDIENNQSV